MPFAIVFTKTDKLGKVQVQKNLAAYRKSMLQFWEEMPTNFLTSAVNSGGKKELLGFISDINTSFKN